MKPACGFGNLSLLAVLLLNWLCSLLFYHPCLERNQTESICFTRHLIIFCLLIRKSIREGREIKRTFFYLPRAPCSRCRPCSDNNAALTHCPENENPPHWLGDTSFYFSASAVLLGVLLVA